MKKLLLLVLAIALSLFAQSQITIHATVKGFGNEISIGYWKDYKFISDTLRLNMNKASLKFDAAIPMYFKLYTMEPASSTPFFMAFPGEIITIEKDNNQITIKGGAESYNTFLLRVNSEMKEKFAGGRPDYNAITKYLLDTSEQFFSDFDHPEKKLIKDIYTQSVITNYKLYPMLIKYSNDTSKINSLFRFIKHTGGAGTNNDDLLKYIDKVNFNNPNIGFASIPDISMMNNFVRILRMHAVKQDTSLQNSDEYIVENKIIKDLFKESRYRSKLLAYNLANRIDQYTKYPMQLAGVSDFIAEFSKEKFNNDLLPAIEELYTGNLSSIGSLSKGSVAPGFKLQDRNGKTVSLSDFKGKVVYIDVWASWCGPCLAEMPYLEELKKKFRNKPVELVSISIDTHTDKWLAKIASMKLGGIQLIDSKGSENSKIAVDYKIHGVPHYVLIDKNGRIASAFAPRPSSEAVIEKEINQLL